MVLVLAAPATSSRNAASFDPSAASIDVGHAVVAQRDGKIVMAGISRRGSRWDSALARYTTRGKLDSSFATGGLRLTHIGRNAAGLATLAQQADGKLILAVGVYVSEHQGAFSASRYTPRGAPDKTFGRNGRVMTSFRKAQPGKFSVAYVGGVALQRDGRIVVAGTTTDVISVNRAALARYTRDGRPDGTFGRRGKVEIDSSALGRLWVSAVAVQRDGKIVVAGYGKAPGRNQSHFTVARFTSRGTIDRSFGNGGSMTTVLGYWSQVGAVAIQADGRIVVAGSVEVAGAGTQLGLVRYLPTGRPDPSFGIDGTVLTDFALYGLPALMIQPDGRIVVACGLNGPRRFGLGRYDVDGTLDPAFGEDGRVRTRFAAGSSARAVARQPDGKIVAAGSAGGDFAVARYTADGTLDESFGRDGRVTTPIGPAWLHRGH